MKKLSSEVQDVKHTFQLKSGSSPQCGFYIAGHGSCHRLASDEIHFREVPSVQDVDRQHCGQPMRYEAFSNAEDVEVIGGKKLTGTYYCERCQTMQPTYADAPLQDVDRCVNEKQNSDSVEMKNKASRLPTNRISKDSSESADHASELANLLADDLEFSGFQQTVADGPTVEFYYHGHKYVARPVLVDAATQGGASASALSTTVPDAGFCSHQPKSPSESESTLVTAPDVQAADVPVQPPNALKELLNRYTVPCPNDCEHSQCPLLRELQAIAENSRIVDVLAKAQETVKPIVDAEKESENVGDLMNVRLHQSSPVQVDEVSKEQDK